MQPSRAFTIIELMVAISILLLLMAAATVGINNARVSSRDTKRIGDIILVAKSVDTAATTNSAYPKGSAASVCLSTDSRFKENTDLTAFPNRVIPTDPKMVNARQSGCTDYSDGYIYHSRYYSTLTNRAALQQENYALEIGLEGEKPFDESKLTAGSSTSPRFQYFLDGPFCGTACYK